MDHERVSDFEPSSVILRQTPEKYCKKNWNVMPPKCQNKSVIDSTSECKSLMMLIAEFMH